LLACLAVFVLVGVLPGGASAAKRHSILLGFNDDWAQRPGDIDQASRVGADVIRFPLSWASVEAEPGEFDWSRYDRLYAATRYNGLMFVLTPQTSPCWAHPSLGCRVGQGGPRPDPEYLDEYERFLRLALWRYPGVAAVEAWNEPNLPRFYLPGPEPRYYVKLLAATWRATKAIRPDLPVLFGGLSSSKARHHPGAMGYLRFLRRANRVGAARYYDAVGIHPYYRKWREVRLALRRIVREQRRQRAARRIWVTELGYSSVRYGEGQQARKLRRALRRLRREPRVRALIVHRMFDGDSDHMGVWGKRAYCSETDQAYPPFRCVFDSRYEAWMPRR
jgi:hypothetical protein